MVVSDVARISQLFLDNDRRRALFLLEQGAAVAGDKVASVVMHEEVVPVVYFHGSDGCRNVNGQSAFFLDNLVDGLGFWRSRLFGNDGRRFHGDFNGYDSFTCKREKVKSLVVKNSKFAAKVKKNGIKAVEHTELKTFI